MSGSSKWSVSEPEALKKAMQLRGVRVRDTDPEMGALVDIESTDVQTMLEQRNSWSGARARLQCCLCQILALLLYS